MLLLYCYRGASLRRAGQDKVCGNLFVLCVHVWKVQGLLFCTIWGMFCLHNWILSWHQSLPCSVFPFYGRSAWMWGSAVCCWLPVRESVQFEGVAVTDWRTSCLQPLPLTHLHQTQTTSLARKAEEERRAGGDTESNLRAFTDAGALGKTSSRAKDPGVADTKLLLLPSAVSFGELFLPPSARLTPADAF